MTGSGADTITTGAGDDIINAGNGANTITAGQGANSITGGSGADTITALDGGNIIKGGGGANIITSGGGSDVIDGGVGADTIVAGGGIDLITVRGGADTVNSGAGDDRLVVNYSALTSAVTGGVTGGTLASGYTGDILDSAGNSVHFVETENFTITTGGGNDTITTGDGIDVLNGRGGADTLRGLGGNDRYYVDNAGDIVNEAVGGGSDRVLTSASYTLTVGQEIELFTTTDNAGTTAINLTGNAFGQTINGNAGANVLRGGGGADILQGLRGNDTYYVDSAGELVNEVSSGGFDRVFTTVSYTLAAGADVEVLATAASGTTTAINLTGNGIANTVLGNAGDNVINGGGGNDTLRGLGGHDTFLFNTALNAATNRDTQFYAGAAAHDADDRIIYNSATGVLIYDSNGNAAGGTTQFATLTTHPVLDHTSFLVG